MVPALGLLDAFKLQDHQSVGVPIPFDDFTYPASHQVCSSILFNGCTDAPQVFSHALQVEDLKISDHIGGHVVSLLSCSLPLSLAPLLTLLCDSGLIFALPELLGGNAQCPIKFARRVFPGDDLGQFDERVLVIELAQAGKEGIADLASGNGHGIGILQRDALDVAIEWTRGVIGQGENLLIRETQTAAHGSIEILSKRAAVEPGNPPVDQSL